MSIDFQRAEKAFEEYLDEYDREDDKIKLKIVHTYCVVDCAGELARRSHLAEEEAGKGLISPQVWSACLNQRSVLSAERVTTVDYWVSYVAQLFDVNLPQTFAMIKEMDYIPRIVGRLHYEETETADKMEQLVKITKEYMECILCQRN